MSEHMLEIIRLATLAANGHNTQPWKFIIHDHEIQIYPDYTRHLSEVDPQDREMWISLGCALENLSLAAQANGYATEVTYPNTAEFIRVYLAGDTTQKNELFDVIPLRQNTRCEYDRRPVKGVDLDQVHTIPLEPGIALWFANTQAETETILEYLNQANLKQYGDKAFIAELIHWLRFNNKEVMASLDGLSLRSLGNPEVPRWLGKWVVSGRKPGQWADEDAKKLRSSSGAVVIASESDDRTGWVRTGQVYERLALKMTSLDIKSALMNQPIEVTDIRRQFQSAIGLGSSLPQLLFRFGHAPEMPRSVRLPVEQVILQS